MDYVLVFDETFEAMEELDDHQQIRMLHAMLEYAKSGDEPNFEKGCAEKVLRKSMKQRVDNMIRKREANRENGLKGGRPRKTEENPTKPNESESCPTEPSENEETPKAQSQSQSQSKAKSKSVEIKRAREERFARFWDAYPRHTAKQNAEKAFQKIDPDDSLLETMLSALTKQRSSHQWSDPQYIPHPATWLNGHRWEDEVKSSEVKTVVAQQYHQREYSDNEPDWLMRQWKEQQEGTA